MRRIKKFIAGCEYIHWLSQRIQGVLRGDIELAVLQVETKTKEDLVSVINKLETYEIINGLKKFPLIAYDFENKKSLNTFNRIKNRLTMLIYPEDFSGESSDETLLQLGNLLIPDLQKITKQVGLTGGYFHIEMGAYSALQYLVNNNHFTRENLSKEFADALMTAVDQYSKTAIELNCYLPFEFNIHFGSQIPELDVVNKNRPYFTSKLISEPLETQE